MIKVAAGATFLTILLFAIISHGAEKQPAGPTAEATATAGKPNNVTVDLTVSKPADEGVFKEIVDLIGYIIWPLALLIIFACLFFFSKGEWLHSVGRWIDSVVKLSFSNEGFILERQRDMIETQFEALQTSQAVTLSVARQAYIPPASTRLQDIPPELQKLADEYKQVGATDPDRIAKRNHIVQEMAQFALRLDLSKDLLARKAAETQDQGLIAALAGVMTSFPEAGDVKRLQSLAPLVAPRRLQLKYQIVLALVALIQRRVISNDEYAAIEEILAEFERTGADASLHRRILSTRDLMNQLSTRIA
jgi:hypothetical protein